MENQVNGTQYDVGHAETQNEPSPINREKTIAYGGNQRSKSDNNPVRRLQPAAPPFDYSLTVKMTLKPYTGKEMSGKTPDKWRYDSDIAAMASISTKAPFGNADT